MIEPEAIYIIVDDDDDEAMRHSLKNLIQSGTTGQNFASVQEFLHSKLTDVPRCLVHDVQYFA
jgi:FixJ family two-component response regulator